MHSAGFFRIIVFARVIPSSTPGVFDTSTNKGPDAFLTASKKLAVTKKFDTGTTNEE